MSGGRLDYFYSTLDEHVGDFGDKELDDLVKDLVRLFHDREWFLSGDICDGTWNEARDEFKRKWFTDIGRQERIETYLADIKEEMLSSFGILQRYCKNCTHWTCDDDSVYGKCDMVNGCMMHRSDSGCKAFNCK